ncbi:MAG TPA: HAD family phosphatase [bacterium]|nr:HAD family phosphatase [bacterium]HOL35102.1 HAD family phosphatase [bacterium]HPP08363.1 HAD family phosphatase [bacterium]
MAIKAVIFDLDGVIFDSEILHQIAWEQIFDGYGIKLEQKDYASGIGISDKDFLEKLKKDKKIPENISADTLIAEKRKKLLQLSKNGAKLMPGAAEFINVMSKDYVLAVASNSDINFIKNLLESSKLMTYFAVVLGYQDISNPKPAPDIYLKCAEKLRLLPEECAVIEDSPTGIRAAKNAGMTCIAITSLLPETMLSEADFIVKSFDIEGIRTSLNSIQ